MASHRYLSDASYTLKTKPTFMCLYLISMYKQIPNLTLICRYGRQAEESIVMMEAAGVRMNVSFEVQNDDEDDVLCTPSTWVPRSQAFT
jgi:hypothetical protein